MAKKVILIDNDEEELIPYTELATSNSAGRVRPDNSTVTVDGNGVLSVNVIATNSEFNTGTATDKTPSVKQVVDKFATKSDDNSVVHKTGNETVAGVKTFTDGMITNDIRPKGSITLGTSTNTWGKQLQFQDTAGKRIARIQPMAIDTTNNRVGMWVNNADNTVEKGIYVDSDGTTSAPTPPAGDNSTKIATTAFVKTAVSNVIHKSGDETLGGTKTFSNSPVVPTPAVNSNTNIPATTAYINVKFQVVSELPSEPDNNVFYFIPE